MTSEIAVDETVLRDARGGDREAAVRLLEPWRRPLFGYVLRMVAHAADAEDLTQDVYLRALESLPRFRQEAKFSTWLFGIATHVCLDHLRARRRWRVEAQLEGERRANSSDEEPVEIGRVMSQPEFVFEIREHINFCFTCIGRSLEPQEQAALVVKEVLGFRNEEGAEILGVSEPQFRHRLAAARAAMARAYDGLCQLINKTGACWQCKGLREFAPEGHRGADLVQITVAPGVFVSPESLLDARLAIVRPVDPSASRTRPLHEMFWHGLRRAEEG